MRTCLERSCRFVEPDMAVRAEAEYLQVNPSQLIDQRFVSKAFALDVGGSSIQKMNVLWRNVHPAEQMLLHERAIASPIGRRQTVELIEVQRVRAREVGGACLVKA